MRCGRLGDSPMPACARRRISLVEYGQPVDIIKDIADETRIDRGKARLLIERAGERVARTLGSNSNPFK